MTDIAAWRTFIGGLETTIRWDADDYMTTEAPKIEGLLQNVARSPAALRARTEEILADPALIAAYAPHMNYPRILMDKFVVHMDPQDRFRVRLHRFKTRRQNGGAVEKVHSHKWHMSTILLSGAYRENVFSVSDVDTERNAARLTLASTHRLESGRSNSLPAGVPHQAINESDDECVITLFVRGPSLSPAARIFNVDEGTYYETFDPLQQIKVGLEAIGRLDPDFH
jgi:hypothetical protein